MDVRLESRAKGHEIEREMAHIRLAAAAERAKSRSRQAVPDAKPRIAPAVPLRLPV